MMFCRLRSVCISSSFSFCKNSVPLCSFSHCRWSSTDSPSSTIKQTDIIMNEEAVDHSISQWYKHIGDEVAEGDALCEVETPSYSFDFIVNNSGYLSEVLVHTGEHCAASEVLARLVETKEELDIVLDRATTIAAAEVNASVDKFETEANNKKSQVKEKESNVEETNEEYRSRKLREAKHMLEDGLINQDDYDLLKRAVLGIDKKE